MIEKPKQITVIGGVARSGTTLTRDLFRAHPDVYGPAHESIGLGVHKPRLVRSSGVSTVRNNHDLERILHALFKRTGEKGFDFDIGFVMDIQRE